MSGPSSQYLSLRSVLPDSISNLRLCDLIRERVGKDIIEFLLFLRSKARSRKSRLDLLNSNAFHVTWESRVIRAVIDTCAEGIGLDVQSINATTEGGIAGDLVRVAPRRIDC